jgi:imidazolonepropionase-like amidohydrolase
MRDPDLAFAAKSWIASWPGARNAIRKGIASDTLPVRAKFVAHELDIVRRLHAAKVPFLAGTDTPAGVDVLPGISLHLELERFVAAGFTPLEALQTATLNPALYYNKLADYGSVQTGRVADLDFLNTNPGTAVSHTRTTGGDVAAGRYLSEADSQDLRAKLKRVAGAR